MKPEIETEVLYPKRDNQPALPCAIRILSREGQHGQPIIEFDGRQTSEERTFKYNDKGIPLKVFGDFDIPKKAKLFISKKKYPNAFDESVLEKIRAYIKPFAPILIAVYFDFFNVDDVKEFIKGRIALGGLLELFLDLQYKEKLLNSEISSVAEFDTFCRRNGLFGKY